MAKVIVRINRMTGETKISAQGYIGETCKEKTKPFETKLGIVQSDTPTEEMYIQEELRENQDQR